MPNNKDTEEIVREEAKRIMKIEGRVKGEVFLTDLAYIKEKKGQKGVTTIEEELKKLGFPFEFKKINRNKWYQIGFRILILLLTKQLFRWGDEGIEEMGKAGPKTSFIIRLFMKYFISREKIFKTAWIKIWPRFFSRGVPETVAFREEGKIGYWIARIRDFPSHPIYCFYLKYYFIGLANLIGRFKKLEVKETKCSLRGDSYHEYILRWEEE